MGQTMNPVNVPANVARGAASANHNQRPPDKTIARPQTRVITSRGTQRGRPRFGSGIIGHQMVGDTAITRITSKIRIEFLRMPPASPQVYCGKNLPCPPFAQGSYARANFARDCTEGWL